MAERADESDWYLREWMTHVGKRQADLVRELGWEKARASKVVNGVTEYRRGVVSQVAAWLGIRPYELLMPPADALALRRLRETAAAIVAEGSARFDARADSTTTPPARKAKR